jgi:hypothetical protein
MLGQRHHILPAVAVLVLASSIAAQDTGALSRRNANYTIEARLDAVQKTLDAREVLQWRNDTSVPARELWFHLYWNAWKNNRSTWLKEAAIGFRGFGPNRREVKEGDWSYCDVRSVKVLDGNAGPASDITSKLHFAAPDDNNIDDQTVLVAPLPKPVNPGEAVLVEIAWKSKIPRTFARTGFRGNYFFIAQWFPKVGVYQADGTWNCHQFHAGTEFFSDYGIYDVKLTVPRGWLLGAAGKAQFVEDNGDGTTTHLYRQADVHDFAWTTSPDYREAQRVFEYAGLKPVAMRLLYQPEHEGQVERHFRATEAALRYYGSWYGVYPYGHITIVDPAWGSGSGGMEYPTLFTCGSRIFNPEGGGSPEGVTVHEAGHQFWYGIVGNNEFEDAWMDEGFNTFSTSRTMEAEFGESSYVRRFFHGYFPVMVPEIRAHRMTAGNRLDGYREAARSDIQATPSFRYFPSTGANITYNKTALWLSTLENMLGWNMLQKIMSTHFERWKFRHPRPADFFVIANEVSGQDLTYFFDEVYRKNSVFDFAVESVSSDEVKTEGYVDRDGKPIYAGQGGNNSRLYETRVVVRRLQDGILPVEVLLKFENGDEVRYVWDSRSPWKLYTVVKPSKLLYAAVDPDRRIVLDVNYTNNSMMLSPKPGFACGKWALKWMIWLQDYMQTLSFLI